MVANVKPFCTTVWQAGVSHWSVGGANRNILLEQTAIAATLFRRDTGGPWIATPHTGGSLMFAGIEISLPLADVHQGLTFAT